MHKHTTLPNLMQKIVSDEDLQSITEAVGYHDTSRTFTVRTLVDFFLLAALHDTSRMEKFPSWCRCGENVRITDVSLLDGF